MVFEWKNNKIHGFSKMNLAATERMDWRGEFRGRELLGLGEKRSR